MTEYKVKEAIQLSDTEIETILRSWSILEWKSLSVAEFKEKFKQSQFHLLHEDNVLVSLLRINSDFSFTIDGKIMRMSELVGFVSVVAGKGYGKNLILHLQSYLKERDMECIGFCFAHNRGFYAKCGIHVFEGKAKYFLEKQGAEFIESEDDDVLDVNLSKASQKMVENLSAEHPAYLQEEEEATQVCEL